jgi:hypothetical protein
MRVAADWKLVVLTRRPEVKRRHLARRHPG